MMGLRHALGVHGALLLPAPFGSARGMGHQLVGQGGQHGAQALVPSEAEARPLSALLVCHEPLHGCNDALDVVHARVDEGGGYVSAELRLHRAAVAQQVPPPWHLFPLSWGRGAREAAHGCQQTPEQTPKTSERDRGRDRRPSPRPSKGNPGLQVPRGASPCSPGPLATSIGGTHTRKVAVPGSGMATA